MSLGVYVELYLGILLVCQYVGTIYFMRHLKNND